jgi:hypothetical protein
MAVIVHEVEAIVSHEIPPAARGLLVLTLQPGLYLMARALEKQCRLAPCTYGSLNSASRAFGGV